MKKLILLILINLLALTLFACDQGTPPPEEDDGMYTVTFDSNGGTAYDPVQVEKEGKVTKPYFVEKLGYSFDGWYYNGERWSFTSDKVNSDMTLVARFIPTRYSITYNTNGGTLPENAPTSYTIESEEITLVGATYGSRSFGGWFADGAIVTRIAAGSIGDLTLEAIFYDDLAYVKDGSGNDIAAVTSEGNTLNLSVYRSSDSVGKSLTVDITVPDTWTTAALYNDTDYSYVRVNSTSGKSTVAVALSADMNKISLVPITTTADAIMSTEHGITLSDGTVVDTNYFPGFVRKAVTFTIDDGNVQMDTTFLNIVRPAGIKGTFNLNRVSAGAVELYKGYEVANHHSLHCLPMRDDFDYSKIEFKDEIFNRETADPAYIYKSTTDGMYYIDYRHYSSAYKDPYWHALATNETYVQYAASTKATIEAAFGEGSVVGFAYPHGALNQYVKEYLKSAGYLYARDTGNLKDKTNFALPTDRFEWTYNADVSCLLDVMALFDRYEDDGELKFFAFGVHSKDFDGKWEVLEEFAKLYGNRPEDFYYASNRDIFEYEDAVKALIISDSGIKNDSDIDLFITINGVKTLLFAHSEILFD